MKNAKKLLAIFVAVLMVASMFAISTVTASAAGTSNVGKKIWEAGADVSAASELSGTYTIIDSTEDEVQLYEGGTAGTGTGGTLVSPKPTGTGANWKQRGGRNYDYNNDQYDRLKAGAATGYVTVTFTGTGIGYVMPKRINGTAKLCALIDGTQVLTDFDTNNASNNGYSEIIWEKRDLEYGNHTATFFCSSADNAFVVDAFVVYNESQGTTEPTTEGETTTEAPVVPVTGISGVPTSFPNITGGVNLTGTVEPAEATNQDITWSVKSGAGTIASNKLTATAYGDIVVTATIANGTGTGTDYTQDFTISAGTAPVAASGHYSLLNNEIYSPNNWTAFTAGSDEDGTYRSSVLKAGATNAIYFIANNERNNGINASNFKTLVIKGKFGCGLNTAAADFVKFRTGAYGLDANTSVNLTNINTNVKAGEDRMTYLVFNIENDKNTIDHTIKDIQLKPKNNAADTTTKIYDIYLSSSSAEDVLSDVVVDTTVTAGQISTKLVDGGENVEVKVDNNSNDDKEFQFWSYRKVSEDMNDAEYAWVLIKEYGVQKSFVFPADGAKDKDGNYTNMVRYKHNDQYVAQFITSVAGAAAGEVGINNIKLDDEVVGQKINIPLGSTPTLTINASNATTITVDGVAANTTGTDTLIGEIVLDCSKAGTRKVTVEATGANGTVTRSFTLNVYNTVTPATDSYATISDGVFTVNEKATAIEYNLTATGASEYAITVTDGGWKDLRALPSTTDAVGSVAMRGGKKAYGTVLVKAYAKSDSNQGIDDLTYDYVTNNRPGAKTFEVTPSTPAGNIAVGATVDFTAAATIENTEAVEYAFLRIDARGARIIKDYSADNTLSWTPALDGVYKIVVVAKGTDAVAHELREEFTYNVGNTAISGANITATVKTMSGHAHSASGLQARVPYIISVDAGVNGVQYNAECSKANFNSAFSPDNEIVFTANKAGTYEINLGIRKNGTGGLASVTETITVTVQ